MSKTAATISTATAGPVISSGEDGFSSRLRESTKGVHREAERTGFIADLIRDRASREGYALFLRNLVPVYATLEAGLDVLGHVPLVAAFSPPGIRRLPSLIADLEAIAGAGWPGKCPLLFDAEAYARTIELAAAGDGMRLVAHAYARYLGDLSGGQILRPLLARTLNLDAGMLSFYDFPALADVQAAKQAMRDALDRIAPQSIAADAIVEEAIAAFRHNIALSQAVSQAIGASVA